MTDVPALNLRSLGSSGLVRYSGYVYDEWLLELQGVRGRRVLREMQDNDAIIGAVLFTIEMLIRQTTWSIVPGTTAAGDEDEQTAEFVDGCRQDMAMTWEDTLSEVLSFLPYGWEVSELLYKIRDGVNSKFSDNKIGWHSWPVRGQETLLKWDFDDMGQVTAMIQLGPPDWVEHTLPMEKLLHFRTTSKRGNPEGRSILRNAYRPWYFRKHLQQLEAIGAERDLAGLPMLKVPSKYLDPGAPPEIQAVANEFAAMLKHVRRDEQEGIMVPSDLYPATTTPMFSFELLRGGGERQFNTNEIITRNSQEIAMSCMADFLMLGHGKVGSYSLGVAKGQMFSSALGAWLDLICAVVNEQGISRLLALNGMPTDDPPRLEHGSLEKTDLEILGAFLANLAAAGMPLDRRPDSPLMKRLMEEADLPEPPDPAELEDLRDPNVADPTASDPEDEPIPPADDTAANPAAPPTPQGTEGK